MAVKKKQKAAKRTARKAKPARKAATPRRGAAKAKRPAKRGAKKAAPAKRSAKKALPARRGGPRLRKARGGGGGVTLKGIIFTDESNPPASPEGYRAAVSATANTAPATPAPGLARGATRQDVEFMNPMPAPADGCYVLLSWGTDPDVRQISATATYPTGPAWPPASGQARVTIRLVDARTMKVGFEPA